MTDEPTIVTLDQCISCERFLAYPRKKDGTDPQTCNECRMRALSLPGIPLRNPPRYRR